MQAWHEYYTLAGGASATLLGLLFVAISLNADLILAGDSPNAKQLALQAFQNYMAALLVSLLFLFPSLSAQSVARGLLVQAGLMIAWTLSRLVRIGRTTDANLRRRHAWMRLIPSTVAYSMMAFSSLQLLRNGDTGAFQTAGFSIMVLLISATRTSWDLLARVAEIRHTALKK